jgi:hypothetical protein
MESKRFESIPFGTFWDSDKEDELFYGYLERIVEGEYYLNGEGWECFKPGLPEPMLYREAR